MNQGKDNGRERNGCCFSDAQILQVIIWALYKSSAKRGENEPPGVAASERISGSYTLHNINEKLSATQTVPWGNEV